MTDSTTPAATVAATEPHRSLPEALAAFQADMPTVAKAKRATIPGKDGKAGYRYQYADLADLVIAAAPRMARHGLSFITAPRRIDGTAQYELAGILLHTSGEAHEGALPLTGRTPQEIGSSITYARRYLLGCLTGIVTDDDDDGRTAPADRLRSTGDYEAGYAGDAAGNGHEDDPDAAGAARPPQTDDPGELRRYLWTLVQKQHPRADADQIVVEVEASAGALNPPADLRVAADVLRLIDVWKD